MSGPDAPQRPVLHVVRGAPTGEELAALTAVVLAAGARTPSPARHTPRSPWASREATLRAVPRHGPGAWRASALPR